MPAKKNTVALVSLLTGATIWGLVWHPYRVLEGMDVSAALGATLTYLVALLLGIPLMWRQLAAFRAYIRSNPGQAWMLAFIALVAGGCNLGYVLATVHGEIMRVLLLFYMAPLWTVLLARLVLDERLSIAGGMVIALSLAGAVIMLWQPQLGLPLPEKAAEWLGLAAGFLFALANVLIRKTPHLSIEAKSMAVFAGVILVGLCVLPFESSRVVLPPAAGWILVATVGVVLLATNIFVQYGLTHMPANQAIVIFLFELVVAALSSWLLAGEEMGIKEWLGGAMIVAASLFSGRLENA